ncbi:hypothetical protein AMTRI_Chr02g215810 [Amborella trichopoda]
MYLHISLSRSFRLQQLYRLLVDLPASLQNKNPHGRLSLAQGTPIPKMQNVCHTELKFVDHLLIHCWSSWELWSPILGIFGIARAIPHTIATLILYSPFFWRLCPLARLWVHLEGTKK